MPMTRHAPRRRASKPARNEPLPLHREVPPMEDEDLTSQEMAEIERILETMAGAESAMGCDYPEGPMSPSGCAW